MKSGVKQQVNMYSKGGKEMSLEKIRQDYKSMKQSKKSLEKTQRSQSGIMSMEEASMIPAK